MPLFSISGARVDGTSREQNRAQGNGRHERSRTGRAIPSLTEIPPRSTIYIYARSTTVVLYLIVVILLGIAVAKKASGDLLIFTLFAVSSFLVSAIKLQVELTFYSLSSRYALLFATSSCLHNLASEPSSATLLSGPSSSFQHSSFSPVDSKGQSPRSSTKHQKTRRGHQSIISLQSLPSWP